MIDFIQKHWLEALKAYFLALLLPAFVSISHLEPDLEDNEVCSRTCIRVRLGLNEHFTPCVLFSHPFGSCTPSSLPSHFSC